MTRERTRTAHRELDQGQNSPPDLGLRVYQTREAPYPRILRNPDQVIAYNLVWGGCRE